MRVLIFYLSFDEHIPLKHFKLQVSGSSEFGLWTHHLASSVSDAALILWVYGRNLMWEVSGPFGAYGFFLFINDCFCPEGYLWYNKGT